jgi:S-adenosylmethionine decarboxylase
MEKGIHLLLDWFNCDPKEIGTDLDLVARLLEAANKAGCKVLNYMSHQFEPYGATAIVMLAESHMSAHYFPEYNYISLDIYTCQKSMRPHKALNYLRKALKPQIEKTREFERG